jgi:hypothetical protein
MHVCPVGYRAVPGRVKEMQPSISVSREFGAKHQDRHEGNSYSCSRTMRPQDEQQ